jgi:hypothetical protein
MSTPPFLHQLSLDRFDPVCQLADRTDQRLEHLSEILRCRTGGKVGHEAL